MPVQRTEEDIIKSAQDERQYRFLKLDNDLKALLVSDVCTEKAAASLAVRVGYLCDPDNVPGLAHFCEHMLFLGTEKYPSENEYTEFLSHHGGSSNASTSAEYTTFFFDVAQEHLCEALDRFAQFFICPLFNADSKNREVNAVDSEHNKNRQVDGWRFHQVCKNTSRPHHPYRKFGTGNKHTLETHPQEQGFDVREELLKFHASHYSANIMSLVVLGKDSLDELTYLVEKLFSPVVNKNIPVPEFPEHPYSDNELQVWIEYVPVKELRQMSLDFPLPDLTEHYASDPTLYVAHLIGHEGPGSLLSYLKVKGWCNTLTAGPSSGAKGYMFFSVTMDLTEEGEDHVEDVVTAVFQYLAMIQREGPQKWIFQECADLGEVDFRFKDQEKPRTYAHILAHSLHNFPPREVLSAPYLLTHFRPDLIELVLDQLQPKNLRVSVVSKRFEGKTELTDSWYGAEYNFRKVDPCLIEQWSAVAHTEELHLPAANEFIPTNFDIVPLEENSPSVPVLIQDTPMTKVWYKQDDTFFTPKACLYFQITTPVAYRDPESCNMINLLIRLLIDALNEYAYNAEIAGIQYKVMNNIYGFMVELKGYNHKQSILLSKIMNKLANFKVDPKKFAIYHEIISRRLRNFKAEQPHRHALYYTSILLDSQMWTTEDLAEALEEISAEQLQAFIPVLLAQVHIEALIHGNLSRQTCLELVGVVEDALRKGAGSKPLLPSQFARHRQVQLPDGSSYLYSTHNVVHDSCCVEIYLQVGLEATQPNMLLELLAQIISEPCFSTLRTQEQLGYIVASGLRRSNGVQGLRFIVQSGKDATFVEQRVEAFLHHVQHHLESLTEEEFGRHRQALSLKRSEKPKKLKDECGKYWGEIISQQYHFVRDEVEVAYLKDITKKDLVDFFQEYVSVTAPSRHKLAVHVVPLQKNTETKQPTVEKATLEPEPTVEVTVEEPTVEKATLEVEPTVEVTVEEPTVEKATLEVEPTVEVTVEEPTVEKVTVEEATPDRATMALGESADRGKASVEKAQEATEGEGKPVEMEETDSVIEALVVKPEVITDLFSFKNSLLLYPLVRPCIQTSLPQ